MKIDRRDGDAEGHAVHRSEVAEPAGHLPIDIARVDGADAGEDLRQARSGEPDAKRYDQRLALQGKLRSPLSKPIAAPRTSTMMTAIGEGMPRPMR